MNDDATNRANASLPPSPTPAGSVPSIQSGNPSTLRASGNPLKVAVPIVLLMAVVFGVTFFSQYTPRKLEDESGGSGNASTKGPPILFGTSIRKWEPFPPREALRPELHDYSLDFRFLGSHEPSETFHATQFWFENSHPTTITVTAAGRPEECGIRLAIIPPDVIDQYARVGFLSGLPLGPVSPMPLLLTAASANFAHERLQWNEFIFNGNQSPEFKVPAAPGSKNLFPYQWGILEVLFRSRQPTPPPMPNKKGTEVTTYLKLKADDDTVPALHELTVYMEAVDAFDVFPKTIDVGEWTESSEARSFTFWVYSSTRGPNRNGPGERGDLTPPQVTGGAGPFVTVGEPERVPETELTELYRKYESPTVNKLREISYAQKRPIRIDSAYRYTVTVKARAGEQLADVGPLERDLALTLPGCPTKQVHIKGMVRGPVWLDNKRTDIDLPSYRSGEGIVHTVRLSTEYRDWELKLLAGESSPKFAAYQLTKLPPASDLGYYELKVSVPRDTPPGSWNGTIVLELQGPKPQRVRIPIHGVVKN